MSPDQLSKLEVQADQPAGVLAGIDSPTLRRLLNERLMLGAALSDLYDLGKQESIEDGDLEAAQANARSALKFSRCPGPGKGEEHD